MIEIMESKIFTKERPNWRELLHAIKLGLSRLCWCESFNTLDCL